jgi:HTH-type transcriptional regulator / antitoxin HigA
MKLRMDPNPDSGENPAMDSMNDEPLKGRSRNSYLELVSAFPLASIRSDEHLAEAQRVMDGLLARGRLNSGKDMYLDALSDLVACYEDAHHPIEPASDADMLGHLLDAKGVTQSEVSRETGIPKSTISEVLSRKRTLSRQMIRKLALYFRGDASILAANI